ncbi:carboxypeptidase regulatory-like domain-containing protein [bacterium]|nr:carboxypeptidase regulatory-like domain-containing protein [bacterium]
MQINRYVLLLLFFGIFLLSCSDDSTNEPATVSVSGVVKKAGGSDVITGAKVTASRHDNSEVLGSAVTDGEGSFTISGLPQVVMDLLVEADGYSPVLFSAMDPSTTTEDLSAMSVQMTAVDSCCSGVFILHVKNTAGEKLQNIPVVIKKDGVIVQDPRTDENGKAVEDGLCPGVYTFRIATETYKVYEGTFTINTSCEPVEMTAVLEPKAEVCCDGKLTVTVKDPQGQFIMGATVRLWKNGVKIAETTTSGNGIAVFEDLCGGKYGVGIVKEGWTGREFNFNINESCDPVSETVVMEQVGCCQGVFTLIVRDANNNPVQNAKVLVRKGSQVIEDPRTDANGKIIVDGLCKGEYNYRVSKEGYKVVEGVFAINENCDPVTKEVTLESVTPECCSGVLTVTALDPQSQPIAGATVRLWHNGAMLRSAQTNASGIAVFDSLCTGGYGVDVSKDGWTEREFEIGIGENCEPVAKTVVMEQQPCCEGVLTLVVRDGNNNPVQNAKVLVRKGSQVIEDPRTDANGKIIVDGLCKGEYNYRVSKEGYKVVEGEFSINSSCDPVTKEVILETESVCCSGVLTVTAVDSSSTPVQGATVKLWKNGVVIESTQTGPNGQAVFDGLCKGEYGVDVMKSGFNNREFGFAINANCDPYNKTVELIP